MRIGVDMDGCLADFNSAYQQLLIDMTGRDLFGENFLARVWNYPEAQGYTREEVSKAWDLIKGDRLWWQRLPPYYQESIPLALERLRRLQHQGTDVYFITARPGNNSKAQTEAWLHAYGYPCATVLISADKGLCALALQLTHYVDDRPENCDDVTERTHGLTHVAIVDRPWNWSAVSSGDERVSSVLEFLPREA